MCIQSKPSIKKMFGTLSEEAEVKVPASKAWALFSSLELGNLLVGKIFEGIDIVESDGGPGTILKLTFKPGTSHHSQIGLQTNRTNTDRTLFVFIC
ncbi:putative START-like domain superfamily protein [Helianthus annuus]|nr:putative START-like domain superfamily protein [Helianthus annuus]